MNATPDSGAHALRPWAIAWLALVLLAVGYLALQFHQGIAFRTDLLALLPREEQDPARHQATDKLMGEAAKKVVLLIGHKDAGRAREAATEIEEKIGQAGLVTFSAFGQKPGDAAALGAFYFPHRQQLLTDGDREALLAGKGESLAQRALAQVYSVGSFADSRLLTTDPFLLLPAYLSGLPVPASRLTLDRGRLSTIDDGITWVLVDGRLSGDPFAMEAEQQFVAALDAVSAEVTAATPELKILRTGAVFFAHAGSETAMSELSTLGAFSLLGTILVLLLVFRRVTPLVLNTLTLLIGISVALAGTIAVFGEVHVATMLFGIGLIGIAVDYGLHFSATLFDRDAATPLQRLHHVLPGITLGLLTTLIGYVVLVLAPFPGLRQIAVFSVMGLLAAFVTVVLWFPLLESRKPLQHGRLMLDASGGIWRIWENPRYRLMRWAIVILAGICGIIGLLHIEANDDVRKMQSLSPDLLAARAEIQRIAGVSGGLQGLLVMAADDEAALQQEETLLPVLRDVQAEGLITGFRAPAQFVPSALRQTENARLVAERLITPFGSLQVQQLGLPSLAAANAEGTPVTLDAAQQSGALPFLADMILAPGQHVIALDGVGDPAALRARMESVAGAIYVDPAGDLSALLGKYRERAVWLIALSALLMLAPLIWRYGFKGGVTVMIPPLLAVTLAPALISFLGESLSFFNVMALVLVLSLGVDYAVFCAEATQAKRQGTLLAVVIATMTTLLSFGMLAFSEVLAVHAFGLTLLLGVLIGFLLAPMAGKVQPRNRRS